VERSDPEPKAPFLFFYSLAEGDSRGPRHLRFLTGTLQSWNLTERPKSSSKFDMWRGPGPRSERGASDVRRKIEKGPKLVSCVCGGKGERARSAPVLAGVSKIDGFGPENRQYW